MRIEHAQTLLVVKFRDKITKEQRGTYEEESFCIHNAYHGAVPD